MDSYTLYVFNKEKSTGFNQTTPYLCGRNRTVLLGALPLRSHYRVQHALLGTVGQNLASGPLK